jgi:hypothetical protein
MDFSPERPRNALSSSNAFTSSFKSTSRAKKAVWGNRFVRDHNDLIYDANPESISSRVHGNLKSHTKPQKTQDNHHQSQQQWTTLPPRSTCFIIKLLEIVAQPKI